MDVSVILIGFNNSDQVSERISMIRAAEGVNTEVILVDNGTPLVACRKDADVYLNCARNPWAGPAIHMGVTHVKYPIVAYVCSHHLKVRKATWLSELACPVELGAALSGDLREIGCGPAALGLSPPYSDQDLAFRYHIQGGVWAGHRDTLIKCPPHERYPHGYEDVVRSWQVLHLGGRLAHVPTVYSTGVRGAVCPNPREFSVIHDYTI